MNINMVDMNEYLIEADYTAQEEMDNMLLLNDMAVNQQCEH